MLFECLKKPNLFPITLFYQFISPCGRQGCWCYAKYAHPVHLSKQTSWLRTREQETCQVKGCQIQIQQEFDSQKSNET